MIDMENNTKAIKLSLFINYFVFAILLNSVGIVILKAQEVYGVTKLDASLLEAFKDLPIAIVSFLVASLLPRIGYKNAMLIALGIVAAACLGMYFGNTFVASKFLFAAVGAAFALIKVSVYSSVGLVTKTQSEHNSLLSNIEGVFMFGIAFSSFLFPFFNTESSPDAWLNVYLFLFGLCIVSFIFLLTAKFDTNVERTGDSALEDFGNMIKLIGKPLIMVFVISAFLFVMIEQAIMTWLPTFNNEVLQIPQNLAIKMGAILTVSIGIGRILGGKIVKKVSWLWIVGISIIVSVLFVLVILPLAVNAEVGVIKSFRDIPLLGYIFPIIGLFLGPIYPLISSTTLNAYPKKWHAHISGLIIIFSALGGVLGSRIIAYIFEHVDTTMPFRYTVFPLILLLISVYLLDKWTKNVKIEN